MLAHTHSPWNLVWSSVLGAGAGIVLMGVWLTSAVPVRPWTTSPCRLVTCSTVPGPNLFLAADVLAAGFGLLVVGTLGLGFWLARKWDFRHRSIPAEA